MLTANEKFAAIALDLPFGVMPRPTGKLTTGDLIQFVSKFREFYTTEVTTPAPPIFVPGDGDYPLILRRRRR